ncbi:TIGR03667 family PPOX class F420-dependent oxidoreductase [Nocardia puris]|uniref:PPOX class probable F420-dependent enzyme n=1 Tax=Nocardia puris TaxID=208602 RepID=A0A366E1P1_9NOCA|nr:TIGR03667 family PPOX class F420-dependent oxidoreductase [Nocardia puris]MBF6209452.1 TIGR03667 family PPOX class F420-dependent oxidoreductase [Nocardia puris]MBF6367818.1 TIGR03667 family PPOX class F420-dependent oxidoreductase [Nocardia puris]MBF6461470.1 TIGR03667 family PPOX class F420-dependent oxidoreductase [Nocardia puris]RBO96286.1 PPOX class probable F420-dependent enzyme [Nocardia puris]
MTLLSRLPEDRRAHVEARLHSNLIAWLTTVRPDGSPASVPVWFLAREDGTFLLYSQPGKRKLRNIEANPRVSLALDVTDIGRDIVRVEGTAARAEGVPPAHEEPRYAAKYAERIGAMFGTPEAFGTLFTEAVIITPHRLHVSGGVTSLD